jgi:hypothetical protein
MPTGMFDYRDDAERMAIEQAIAFVTQLRDLALTATPGQVLDQCENHALDAGRDLLRTTLQQAVQTSIDHAEEKKGRIASARAGADGVSSDAAGGT